MKIGGISSVFTVFIFKPQGFAEIGKGLIQGKITPAFSCSQVAEPLMKKFMGYIVFVFISVYELAGILLKGICMQGSRGIFHRTTYIVARCHLRIFYPGVFKTKNTGIKSYHFRG